MASRVLTSLNMDNEEDAMCKLLGYQADARRAYNAAFKQLQVLQGDRFDRQSSSLPQAEQEQPGVEAKVVAFTTRNTKLQN